jgi:hypothetical protein
MSELQWSWPKTFDAVMAAQQRKMASIPLSLLLAVQPVWHSATAAVLLPHVEVPHACHTPAIPLENISCT